MTQEITKKTPASAAPTMPLDADIEGQAIEASPAEDVAVDWNEADGIATITLDSGTKISFKEPKASKFLHFASRFRSAPAWQQTDLMASFFMAHFMICKVIEGGKSVAIPTYEGFEDMLGDGDMVKVGAVFACFPDVGARLQRTLGS